MFLLATPLLFTACGTTASAPLIDPGLPSISRTAMTLTGTLDAAWLTGSAEVALSIAGFRKGFPDSGAVGAGSVDRTGRFTVKVDESALQELAARPEFGSLCPPESTYGITRSELTHLDNVRTTWLSFLVRTSPDRPSDHVDLRQSWDMDHQRSYLVYATGEGRIDLSESCQSSVIGTTDVRYNVDITFTPGWNFVELDTRRTAPNWWAVTYRSTPLPGALYLK